MPETKIRNKGKATIRHLPASELWKLLDHLEAFAPEGSDEDERKRSALSQLPNFFEGMTLLQKAELESVCLSRSDSIYSDFVRDNPDIVVNLDGLGPEVKQSGWQVKSLALDLRMKQAEEDMANGKYSNSGKQMLRSKTLECLKGIEPIDYGIARTNFSLKNKGKEDVAPVLDSIVENSGCVKEFDVKAFLSVMLQYMTRNDVSSYGYFSLFVFQRLDCLAKDIKENGKPTEKSDIEFVEAVRSVLSK